MKFFKMIEVDVDAERKRIANAKYNKRQRAALVKLCDLFEAGEFQKCLDHVNCEKAFPYNEKHEYSEQEHIGEGISNILHSLAYSNVFTESQIIEQAKEYLDKQPKTN